MNIQSIGDSENTLLPFVYIDVRVFARESDTERALLFHIKYWRCTLNDKDFSFETEGLEKSHCSF